MFTPFRKFLAVVNGPRMGSEGLAGDIDLPDLFLSEPSHSVLSVNSSPSNPYLPKFQ